MVVRLISIVLWLATVIVISVVGAEACNLYIAHYALNVDLFAELWEHSRL